MKATVEQRRIVHAVLASTAETLGLTLAEIREAVAAPPPRPKRGGGAKRLRVAYRKTKSRPASGPRKPEASAVPAPTSPVLQRRAAKPPAKPERSKRQGRPPPESEPEAPVEPLAAFELAVFRRLVRNPLSKPQPIAEELGKSVGVIARAIEGLARKGYIQRGANQCRILRLSDGRPAPKRCAEDDARQVEAFLAEKGATICPTTTVLSTSIRQRVSSVAEGVVESQV